VKKFIVNNLMLTIKNNSDYDDIKLKEIKYGLESLYLTLSKTIAIFAIAYYLNTIKTLTLIMIFYGILRLTGFGLHAKKSWQCWISSGIIFLLLPYICQNIIISLNIKVLITSICIILIIKYAPADTEKRPLINEKRRRRFKYICTITSIIYLLAIIMVNNNYLENIIFFSVLLQTLLLLPISYKIFGLKYNNYKNYLRNC